MGTRASLGAEFYLCFPLFFIFFLLPVGLLVSSNSVWGIKKSELPSSSVNAGAWDAKAGTWRWRLLLSSYRRARYPVGWQPDRHLYYTECQVQLWVLSFPDPAVIAIQFSKFWFTVCYISFIETECKRWYKWCLHLKCICLTILESKVAVAWSSLFIFIYYN